MKARPSTRHLRRHGGAHLVPQPLPDAIAQRIAQLDELATYIPNGPGLDEAWKDEALKSIAFARACFVHAREVVNEAEAARAARDDARMAMADARLTSAREALRASMSSIEAMTAQLLAKGMRAQ